MTNRILNSHFPRSSSPSMGTRSGPTESGSGRINSIDTAQLEYTATTLMTYGTIVFAVVLGLGSITYMTIQQLKK